MRALLTRYLALFDCKEIDTRTFVRRVILAYALFFGFAIAGMIPTALSEHFAGPEAALTVIKRVCLFLPLVAVACVSFIGVLLSALVGWAYHLAGTASSCRAPRSVSSTGQT
ncbi:MAG: hypothetical protein AB7E80_15250 [Hyphomicrobiaceae bacterium]